MPWTFEATERGYANLWRTATIKAGADDAMAENFANKIIAAEQRYKAVQAATGVPWYFIGALHMRENACRFDGVLHNGDRIIGIPGAVTTRVPAGRGPFQTWEASGIDALKLKDMQRVQVWSVARMLFQAEVFNGIGYVSKHVNAPYVWAGTNHEQLGKYIRDHVFDPNAEDTQLGVAAVLIRLAQKRPDIHADLYPTEKPMDEPDLITEIKGLREQIAGLPAALVAALKGLPAAPIDLPPKPEPVPAKPAAPVSATVTTATPITEKPGVGIGTLGLIASLVLNAMGVTGPMTGDGATTTGQLLPILSGGIAALGATGMFGSWGSALSSVFSMFAQGMQKK